MHEENEKTLDAMLQALTRSTMENAGGLIGIAGLLVMKGVITKDELIGAIAGGKQGVAALCETEGADASVLQSLFDRNVSK